MATEPGLGPHFCFGHNGPNLQILSDAFIHEGSDVRNTSRRTCIQWVKNKTGRSSSVQRIPQGRFPRIASDFRWRVDSGARAGRTLGAEPDHPTARDRLAARVSQDPTFRLIGSEKIWDRGEALTSRLQSFETELLAEPENLAGLCAINWELIAKAEAIESPQRVVLDIDSTEIPVYGQQENSAYNGHFGPPATTL